MSDTATPQAGPQDNLLLAAYLLPLAGLVLAFAGIFTGPWAGLAGVACLFAGALLAWAIRRGAGGDWRASHATWLIRMFWVIVIIGLLGWYGRYWFFGGPLLLVLWLWAFWRLGKGLLHWHRNRPVERPETWF